MEQANPEPSGITVQIERLYVLLSREELLDQADEIFLGQFQRISPTRWNQDSGEYWQETTQESAASGQTTTAWRMHLASGSRFLGKNWNGASLRGGRHENRP